MAQVKVLKVNNGSIGELSSGSDTILPALLGTGTRNGTKFLRDDGTWQNVSGSSPATYSEVVTVTFGNGSWPGVNFGTIPTTNIPNLTLSSKILSIDPINFIVSDINQQNDVNSDSI
jgi:hypothetical protein